MFASGRSVIPVRHCIAFNAIQRISRYTSTKNNSNDSPSDLSIRKSVFVSQCTDVFANLALEDWLYRNYDFSEHHVLLLWRNDPCVVFGRHQNPWKECDVQTAEKRGITLARRNSGGGTVYHDNGNLNLSFFTPRERYNRKYNLHIITRALLREWHLESVINKREDIIVDGYYKVSGTAAKLGRPNAYHHCTLLVDVNKDDLSVALKRKEDIITNATTSIRSPIKNLIDVNPDIEINKLMTAIGREYLSNDALVLENGEHNLFQEKTEFHFINPNENCFPGLDKLTNEFRSWSWNFGKTPKFTITRTLEVIANDGKTHELNLRLEVENGIVEEVRMNMSNGLTSTNYDQDICTINNFCGVRYYHEIIEDIISTINCKTVILKTTETKDKSDITVTQ